MAKLIDVYNAIDSFAPYQDQLEYDNSGIKLGDLDTDVTGIMVTLDTTMSVIMEAKERGCNVIVEHHPSIWTPLKSIDNNIPQNQCLINAIKLDIAIISAHTNVDVADGGLNDHIASMMGLKNIRPLASARAGELEEPITMGEFAIKLKELFQDKYTLTVGNLNKIVKKVAVISGGGGSDSSSLIETYKDGCDVFVTSDVKHNVARLAKDLNYGIIELSHHASEYPFIDFMVNKLNEKLKGIRIYGTTVLNNPYN
ncbi:MAG: Nif3-like dinuclear metal center hexameric protein [Clostridiales bacterium]|nr:Nif3-like dinuclear metal center hexameric protein [Clostridiales bacterium]